MWRGIALLRGLIVPSGVILAAVSVTLHAQIAAAPLTTGAKLRVFSPDVPDRVVTGVFVSADSQRLSVDRSDNRRVTFPWARVDSVQLSRGKMGGSARKSALVGALVGGAFLAAVGATSADEGDVVDPAAVVGLGFVAGALGGAIVGGIIGSSRTHERWESVPLQPQAGTGASRSLLRARVAFVGLRFD